MSRRGWTEESIREVIEHPARMERTRDRRHLDDLSCGRRNDPAMAYIQDDGQYVVLNLVLKEVIAISDRKDPEWHAPDWTLL